MTHPRSAPLLDSALDLPLVRKGKVRDVYAVGDDHLLIVATDRISAFDYVLGSGIPDKGRILTAMSVFWFAKLEGLVPHHLVSIERADFPREAQRDELDGRTMLVHRTEPFPVECVARGYLSGSGWKDYQRTGAICGVALPAGLRESDRLPSPDLHAGHQGRQRPRREHQRSRGRRGARQRARRAPARADAGDL